VFKSKSSQNSNSPRGACKGFIFAMEVTEERVMAGAGHPQPAMGESSLPAIPQGGNADFCTSELIQRLT
jgi:hypothetical protein